MYSEQVGEKRQAGGRSGEMNRLYITRHQRIPRLHILQPFESTERLEPRRFFPRIEACSRTFVSRPRIS